MNNKLIITVRALD